MLRTLKPSEKQIATDDNRWLSVRIMPFRRLDNVIDGVVITAVGITATKELESALRRSRRPCFARGCVGDRTYRPALVD
jgi:two-component system, chemotaxis family, CheB/CheR fusion protein